jgi:hypothetical protein
MREITKIVIGVTILGLIAYDIFAYLRADNATISVIITDWSFYTPWVPFMFGFLMGHFFWPAKGSK